MPAVHRAMPVAAEPMGGPSAPATTKTRAAAVAEIMALAVLAVARGMTRSRIPVDAAEAVIPVPLHSIAFSWVVVVVRADQMMVPPTALHTGTRGLLAAWPAALALRALPAVAS